MSFEHRCFFEIGDILAVHFHCDKCGSETVLRLGKIASADWPVLVTSPCAHCRAPSGIHPNTVEGQAFIAFIDSLAKMAEIVTGRNLRLRFEIECSETVTSKLP